MIPEFVGRFPVLTTLSDLDVPALICILTEPRNALIKQYQALFNIEGVALQFTQGAVKAVQTSGGDEDRRAGAPVSS